jgi:ribose transport system substrate-binding protein
VENGGNAVCIFGGQEAGEDSGGLPSGFGGPGVEAGEQFFEGGVVFVGDDEVVTEAFDPAFGTGGEPVGGGAGGGEGLELGRSDPHRGLWDWAGSQGGVHDGESVAGLMCKQTRARVCRLEGCMRVDKKRGLPYNGLMNGVFGSALAVLAAVALMSCGGERKRGEVPRGTIAVSLLTLENPFFKIIGDHLAAEAKAQGFETLIVSADKDMAKQGNQVKDFIVKGVDAIVLSPCDPKSVVPVIQEANAAGIPVFTVDIPCPDPAARIVTQIATDNYGGGREAGMAMIEVLGKTGGKVAILHLKQAQSCILRVKGFREVIEAFNAKGGAKIELAMEIDGGGARDIGYRAAEDALQAHPDLRGIFAINDPSALGARAALEKANKADQVAIIGFDGMKEGKVAIKEGKMYADPIQFPDRMGVEIVNAFVSWSRGEEVAPEILIPTKLYRQADGEKDPDLK